MTLGERIKEHRNRLGLSQEKIADMVGISRQAVTKWETNKSVPCMENLIMLSEIFGVSLNELSGYSVSEAITFQPVKSSWKIYGRTTLRLGMFFLALTALLLIIRLSSLIKTDLSIWALVFGINGAVWSMLGILFNVLDKRNDKRLKRLKNGGLFYNAKIERIINGQYWIRIGSMRACYVECSYHNKNGEKCLVKSGYSIIEEHSPRYNAVVYVNSDNPMDYAVEISTITGIENNNSTGDRGVPTNGK